MTFETRKLLLLTVFPVMICFSFSGTELSKEERTDAIHYLKETKKYLAKAIKDLSENQLKWKPADSIWSITDCVEHLALSEKKLFDRAMNSLKTEANPAKRTELKYSDESIKQTITDRTNKTKTREGYIPTGQFGDAKQCMAVFTQQREIVIRYIKGTRDDLRNHFCETSFGLLDTYQMLLFISGHSRRHTMQIEELKVNPGFPKQ